MRTTDQLCDDQLREIDKGHFRLLNKGKVGGVGVESRTSSGRYP